MTRHHLFSTSFILFELFVSLIMCCGCIAHNHDSFLNALKTEKLGNLYYKEALFENIVSDMQKKGNLRMSNRGEFSFSTIIKCAPSNEKQTGIQRDTVSKEEDDNFMRRRFDIQIKSLSIYDAFLELSRQTGIDVQFNYGTGTFIFKDGKK